MAGIDRIQKRFDELSEMADDINASRKEETVTVNVETPWRPRELHPHEETRYGIDGPLFVQWQTSVAAHLIRVFGVEDPTSRYFSASVSSRNSTSHAHFDQLLSIFLSAKDQYEGGYLFDVRNLVHASIFSDELAQADHFLREGYKVPAAVVAGVALEATLRELSEQHPDLEPAKADTMISDLAKNRVFNKMRADQLRAWMKIRNSAAHGKPDEFDENDVSRMIDGVRDFIANHMR